MSGSDPVRTWPAFSQDERDAVDRVLQSGNVNYWTGEEGRYFEKEFAAFHEVNHGIALANGTLALELALTALGIGPGDEVVVTPRSFFASVSCVVRVGATPVFADVDLDSQNITAESIAAVFTEKTKAIVPVHLAGWPCDMPSIMRLAEKRGLFVIEDCAQAHGASIAGRPIGSFGHMAAFSFCQDKIISTAGEGGMLLMNDDRLWKKSWAFKDHGKSWDKVYGTDHPPGFRWQHDSFGTNWRLTELQSAVGRIQLRKLNEWSIIRARNASYLFDRLEGSAALRIPKPPEGYRHANYVFYMFVNAEELKTDWNRDRIINRLVEQGLPGLSGSCSEIYREAAFTGESIPELPNAKALGEQSIMLPVHPGVSQEFLDKIILELSAILAQASIDKD
jgi:dTDP-4-amino-4,6-dideoxygalactose transaminase